MTSATTTTSRLQDRWFGRSVGAAAICGFAIRVASAVTPAKIGPLTDSNYYHVQANLLAKGHGFADPFLWAFSGRIVPTAAHPPLFPLFLSLVSRFGATSVLAHRITAGAVGVLTIVVVALLARELAGAAAGISAAAIAAIYPNLWGMESSLMSESLAAALVAFALFLAIRLAKEPSARRAILLAVVIALASVTRPETILLLPVLALPVILTRRALSVRRRSALVIAAVMASGLVVAPWLVRNLTGFSRPVLFSTNADEVIGVANCPFTYHGRGLGAWSISCVGASDIRDDAGRTAFERRRGFRYLTDHVGRFVSVVVWARIGRVWDIYRPFDGARYSALEGRRLNVARAGLFVYWASLPFALVGAILLWKRNRTAVLTLLTPFVVVVATAIYAYGEVRFRAIAEPSLIVFAAIGFSNCWQRARSSRGTISS
jgi:4-amino-4-deoxy-L-arabinose transferase-like glycosyltransferase